MGSTDGGRPARGNRRRILRRTLADGDVRELFGRVTDRGYAPKFEQARTGQFPEGSRTVAGAGIPFERTDPAGTSILVWREDERPRVLEFSLADGGEIRRLSTANTEECAEEMKTCQDVDWSCVGSCVDGPWECTGDAVEGELDCCEEWGCPDVMW